MMIRAGALLLAMLGQMGGLGDAPAKPKQYVMYVNDQPMVPAGKKSAVELRFKVMDGFHVNSHTPKSELLIPTRLTLQPGDGVKAGEVEYPKGTEYAFEFQPGEKLDVYSGSFVVKVPVEVSAGEHTVGGTLRYQASDHAASYPPKSLPVSLVVVGK